MAASSDREVGDGWMSNIKRGLFDCYPNRLLKIRNQKSIFSLTDRMTSSSNILMAVPPRRASQYISITSLKFL